MISMVIDGYQWLWMVIDPNLCLVVTIQKDFNCHTEDPPPFLPTPNGTKKKRVYF